MKKNIFLSLLVFLNFYINLTDLRADGTVDVMDPPAAVINPHHRQYYIYPSAAEGSFYEVRRGTSEFYREGGVQYPKVPLFHPYHPLGDEDVEGGVVDHARIDGGISQIPLILQIPPQVRAVLPEILNGKIAEYGIDAHDSLGIFLVAQNFPWTEGTTPCFRPQYGTDGPWAQGRQYWAMRDIETGLFYSDSQNVHFEGHNPNEFIKEQTSAHPTGSQGPSDGAEGDLVLSGDVLRTHGFDFRNGQSLWSGVFYNDGYKNRAIITLHWMLNDGQAEELSNTLQATFPTVGASPYAGLPGLFERIKALPSFQRNGGHVQKLEPFYPYLADTAAAV